MEDFEKIESKQLYNLTPYIIYDIFYKIHIKLNKYFALGTKNAVLILHLFIVIIILRQIFDENMAFFQ